jgi:hypothetical protein
MNIATILRFGTFIMSMKPDKVILSGFSTLRNPQLTLQLRHSTFNFTSTYIYGQIIPRLGRSLIVARWP